MTLPEKSTGWTRGTFELSVPHVEGGKHSVEGLVKYGYGVSPGKDSTTPRLTHLGTGKLIFHGPQGVCKRLGEALHRHVPNLERDTDSPGNQTLTAEEIDTMKALVRLAFEEGSR